MPFFENKAVSKLFQDCFDTVFVDGGNKLLISPKLRNLIFSSCWVYNPFSRASSSYNPCIKVCVSSEVSHVLLLLRLVCVNGIIAVDNGDRWLTT